MATKKWAEPADTGVCKPLQESLIKQLLDENMQNSQSNEDLHPCGLSEVHTCMGGGGTPYSFIHSSFIHSFILKALPVFCGRPSTLVDRRDVRVSQPSPDFLPAYSVKEREETTADSSKFFNLTHHHVSTLEILAQLGEPGKKLREHMNNG